MGCTSDERQRARSLKIAGSLIFVSAVQFILIMIISEAIYPHYSVANNYISDLGVGVTASMFNASVAVLGIAVIVSAYFIKRGLGSAVFSILIALAGAGALCVGILNESFGMVHTVVSVWTFLFGAIATIYSARVAKPPVGYLSIPLGVISLLALAMLAVAPQAFGLGVGGFERLVVYPFLLWGIAFAGYMMGFANRFEAQ